MRPADTRLQSIGATFAVHYFTALVQAPESLVALYTPTAHVAHCFRKASGAVEIGALLTTETAAGLKEVKLEDVSATRTPAGTVKVTIAGELIRNTGAPQAFTQEVELRELESNVFGITSDKLSYTAAGQTAWAVAEPAAAEAKTEEKKEEKAAVEEPAAAEEAPVKAATPAASSRKSTPAPAPAAPAEPHKKPASFAEALKLKKAGEGAAFSNKAVRVVASGKPEAEKAEKAEKTEKHEKADEKKSGEKKPHGKKEEKAAKPRAAGAAAAEKSDAAPVVFYDIILKELSPSVTEAEVRALVTPVAAVKLVNVVKSEKRRRGKEAEQPSGAAAAPAVITFAFVQLDRPADAPASHVKDVVAQLSAHNKDLHVEEVREKKPHAPAAHGAAHKRPERKAAAAEHKGKAAAAAPAKPAHQPKKAE